MVWNSRACLQDVCDKKSRTHSHLSGGAFTMYQQLSEEGKSDVAEIKKAFWFVLSTDKFIACEQFIAHHLHSGESVNVYLQGLLWGNIGTGLACAFVAGLPIWKKLWVSSRRAKLNVSQLLSRGQAVMKDEMSTKEPFAAATHPIETDVPLLFTKCPTNISCYRCSEANCYAKDCQYWPAGINASCYQ